MCKLAPSERVVPEMEDTVMPVGRVGRAREEDKGVVEGEGQMVLAFTSLS